MKRPPRPEQTMDNTTEIVSFARATSRMSNSGYHRCGKPVWWVAAEGLADRKTAIRGDEFAGVKVAVPVGTMIELTVGRGADRVVCRVRTEATLAPKP